VTVPFYGSGAPCDQQKGVNDGVVVQVGEGATGEAVLVAGRWLPTALQLRTRRGSVRHKSIEEVVAGEGGWGAFSPLMGGGGTRNRWCGKPGMRSAQSNSGWTVSLGSTRT
jgi:hypothetical protein